MPGLPSWVPDFKARMELGDTKTVLGIPDHDYPRVHLPTLTASKPGELMLKGQHLTPIDSIGPAYPIPPQWTFENDDRRWSEIWQEFTKEVDEYLEKQELRTQGQISKGDRTRLLDFGIWKASEAKQYSRIFTTDSGHFGIARGDLKEGDDVVHLLGSPKHPFIIRWVKDNVFRLVGTAEIETLPAASKWFKGKDVGELDAFVLI